ncbi:MAG: hypothetical protein IJ729_00675 [Alloprevotella sp.]|nr:hypothetical protein [Alloprevotella sp.]
MKQILITAVLALCTVCTSAWAQEYLPFVEEGKTWKLELSMANGQHLLYDYSVCKGDFMGGIQFWNLTESCTFPDTESTTESTRKLYVGEKDGKLYLMNEGKEASPSLFMDFSLTAGSSIGLETVKFDGQNVRLEVTAVSDTVLASPSDKSSRRCLHVSYLVEDRPGNWAEAERDVWVEGIGSLKYGIMFPYYFGTTGGIMSLAECSDAKGVLYLAQTYRPLLEEGKTWTVAGVHATWAGSPFRGYGRYNIYTLRGVETVDGKAWRQLFCYDMDEQGNKGGESRVALLREENGKVFFYDMESKAEKLLMDFGATEGGVLTVEERAVSRWNDEDCRTLEGVSVSEVASYSYGGNTLKRLNLKWPGEGSAGRQPYEFSWVEGVGAIGQEPFNNNPIGVTATFVPHLADCQVNGEVIYRDEAIYAYMQETLPGEFPGAEGYRAFVEEGKTWRVAWVAWTAPTNTIYYDYAMRGDSVIDGMTWKKILRLPEGEVVSLVREAAGRIYTLYPGYPEGTLMVDFLLTEGSDAPVWSCNPDGEWGYFDGIRVAERGIMENQGRKHAYIKMEMTNGEMQVSQEPSLWIQGVGNASTLFYNQWNGQNSSGRFWQVTECWAGDERIYLDVPQELSERNLYLPLRDGISSPLVTRHPSTTFDLQGRRLKQEPQQGVFIRDGKKVIRSK